MTAFSMRSRRFAALREASGAMNNVCTEQVTRECWRVAALFPCWLPFHWSLERARRAKFKFVLAAFSVYDAHQPVITVSDVPIFGPLSDALVNSVVEEA